MEGQDATGGVEGDALKAVKYLIKAAPAGEITDVIQLVCELVGGEAALNQNADVLAALRKWYETHRYHIRLPEGQLGMVTSTGKASEDASDFTYYDDGLGITFNFNPFNLQATVQSEERMEVPTSQFRQDLHQHLDAYLDKAFRQGKARYAVHQQGADDHQIIEISCINNKLDSFWAGEWQSTWTVSGGVISGDIKIRCHYFETGNIQFNLDKSFDSIQCANTADAAEVVKSIKKIEDEYQGSLDEMYQNIQENVLKRMRRAVTLAGQKFDWEKGAGIIR